jgi:hypothetical protein
MPVVLHDLFPAVVGIAMPDDERTQEELSTIPFSKGIMMVTSARVVITNDSITIATDTPEGPKVAFSQPIDPDTFAKATDVRREDSRITTTNGIKVVYRKDEGCGCGSRLRSWSPFRGSSSVLDPK